MIQTIKYNDYGEPVCTEYVRDQYEEEEALCEEMNRRAEDPLYSAQMENQKWYDTACSIFEERGIEVPADVIRSLSRELRKKDIENKKKKALADAQPIVDFLNEKLPDCDAKALYHPETFDEIASTEIYFNGKRPTSNEIKELVRVGYEMGICLEDYI